MRSTTRLRELLRGDDIVVAPGAFDGLSARLVQDAGFAAVYATGGGIARSMGMPDLGLLGMTEVVDRIVPLVDSVTIPVIADADTGYGNALNVMRTIDELAIVGVSAATIEDTLLPAPFGATGKSHLISIEEGVGKMRAALVARHDSGFHIIGRTSAPLISSLADTLERLLAYQTAGVDALFVVGLKSVEDLRFISSATKLPLILGSAVGGLSRAELAQLRVRICLQGHLPIMAAVQAIYETMTALRDGMTPGDIKGTASAGLMRDLTRQSMFEGQSQHFLK